MSLVQPFGPTASHVTGTGPVQTSWTNVLSCHWPLSPTTVLHGDCLYRIYTVVPRTTCSGHLRTLFGNTSLQWLPSFARYFPLNMTSKAPKHRADSFCSCTPSHRVGVTFIICLAQPSHRWAGTGFSCPALYTWRVFVLPHLMRMNVFWETERPNRHTSPTY